MKTFGFLEKYFKEFKWVTSDYLVVLLSLIDYYEDISIVIDITIVAIDLLLYYEINISISIIGKSLLVYPQQTVKQFDVDLPNLDQRENFNLNLFVSHERRWDLIDRGSLNNKQ